MHSASIGDPEDSLTAVGKENIMRLLRMAKGKQEKKNKKRET